TDISDVFEKMRGVIPQISRNQKVSTKNGEHLQTPAQLKKINQPSQCIKCMNCYSACPAYGNNKKFIGPMVGALAQRYNADSRDQSKAKRMDKIVGKDGVWDCSFVGECSKVCPKRVDPATTMQRLKITGVLRLAKKIISKK
ncbi:MAG: 4Fe-4S dicluster domain-containing protein, partial [Patescibacteria group bacterium]